MSLTDLVDVDRADVYVDRRLTATLTRGARSVRLEYVAEAVSDIATTLPRSSTSVTTIGRSVPTYFAGALPEGRRLTALRIALKTSADDDFTMLLGVGGDMVGNVQVVPSGTLVPTFGTDHASVTDLSSVSFTELFEQALGADLDRVALAGVQDKVSGRMISLPVTTSSADQILKLDPHEFPHLVANEAFFIAMARDCGLDVVDVVRVTDREGRPGLVVERFDRHRTTEEIVALATEDGCQVSDRYPADKYALSMEAVMNALANQCAARSVAARSMFRQLVFAILTGNGDLHAKNLSIVNTGVEWRVSPAYDLPSSYPYGDTTLALSIGGSREAQVSRRRLRALAVDIDLPVAAADQVIDDLTRRVEPWAERLDELPFDDRRISDLRRLMRNRLELLRV